MNRFFGCSLALVSFVFSTAAQAATAEDIAKQLKSTPYMEEKPAGNDALFAKYCVGNPNTADIPQPNYTNALVLAAAQKLTESKTLANARLKEMGQEQFLSNITQIQTNLNEIITKSTDAAMVSNAKTLLAEISKPNIKSISAAASTAYKAMSDIVLKQLKKDVALVSPKLQTELKGIDIVVLTKLVNELDKFAKAEIKGADMDAFKKAFDKVYPIVKAGIKPVDYIAVQSIAEQVLLLANMGDETTESITGAQAMAKDLIDALKNGAPTTDQQVNTVNYYLSDMQYYLEEAKNLKYSADGFEALLADLAAESDKISLKYIGESNERLMGLVQDLTANKEEIIYAADDLAYSLESNLNDGTTKLFTSANESLAIDYIAQVKNFQSESILTNVSAIITQLNLKTQEGNENAINTADSVVYSLEQMSKLSVAFKTVIANIKAELTKQQSQTVINIITKAEADLKSTTEFSQDTYYSLSSLQYYLKGDAAPKLSAPTQLAVDGLLTTMDNSSYVAEISSYMNIVVEDGKEADHFYFYGGVRRLYKLGEKLPTAAVKAGANKEAHWFITQLCGEFRDRATMIEAKLKWVQNMNILAKSDVAVIQPETLAQAKNVWMRITAKAYYPYISAAARIWEERRAAQERYITIGGIDDIDNPVVGLTVCETKYVMAKYVATETEFESLEAHDAGLKEFQKECPKEDLTDYYDFRGDSNFKHYSPESNGMIWFATSLARGCSSSYKANGGIFSDEDCEAYFKNPFFFRYNAARAGFAAWLFRDDKHADTFATQDQMVAIYPHKMPYLAPFGFGFTETSSADAFYDYNPKWLGVPMAWNSADIGFNGFTGLGTAAANQEQAYVLLRDAVDRHTDWYSSGYNDSNGVSKNQAYSPFVASSYVMQSSDGFTQCGTTVQCPPDGLKRWMFVFRIKAQNWYTPARIQNNEPVDFDKMWFDETSFGVSGLADGEHAWDRLGTAQEEELDSILYLINVNYDSFDGGDFAEEEMGE